MPTPAQWQSSLVLDQILTTTVQNYMQTLFEQVLTNNFLYYWLFSRNRIKTMDGGEAIVVPLMYGLNETVRSYSGFDPLDVTPQDGLTPARYEWKQISGSLSISRKMERQNSGKARMLSLLEAKMEQLRMSFNEVLGAMAFGRGLGNGGKDFLGLRALVEPGSYGTVGGIDGNTYTWWRNQAVAASGYPGGGNFDATGTADTIEGQTMVRDLYMKCVRGTQQPDLAITHLTTYSEYEAALAQNERFTDSTTAMHGFMNLKVKNATMAWEESYIWGGASPFTTVGSVGQFYMLNSQFLQVVVDSETNFVSTPFVRPHDQDARTSQILLMGNLVASNRKRQGVIYAIT